MLPILGRPSQSLLRGAAAHAACLKQLAPAACGHGSTRSHWKRRASKPRPPARLSRLEWQGEVEVDAEQKSEWVKELKMSTVFSGQLDVLYKAIVDEFEAEHQRYKPRVAPIAVSYLYSQCQSNQQLQAVVSLHRRFRFSQSSLGGGSDSVSHNAVVACLRLGDADTALEILMNKFDFSVWPPAATYTLLLDYMLSQWQKKPDMLADLYEAACLVQRDGVQRTDALTSLCVLALSIHDANDNGAEDEVTAPPSPYTQPNLPGWEEFQAKELRDAPLWTTKLETRYERVALARHMMQEDRAARRKLYPVAYSYLISTLAKLGKYDQAVEVLGWAGADLAMTTPVRALQDRLVETGGDETETLQKITEEEVAMIDALAGKMPSSASLDLTHTTVGMTQIPLVDGQIVDMNSVGVTGEKNLRSHAGWEEITTFERRPGIVIKIRSMYKMPPQRWTASETDFVNEHS